MRGIIDIIMPARARAAAARARRRRARRGATAGLRYTQSRAQAENTLAVTRQAFGQRERWHLQSARTRRTVVV